MQIVLDRQITIGDVTYQPGVAVEMEKAQAFEFARRGIGWFIEKPPANVAVGISGLGSVTCIMPTRNRREWVPRAIRLFKAQTYHNLELLILDNGDSIRDLVPYDSSIRYARVEGKQTIGQLRNYANQLSAAEYIAHWDDDDWYHPERIAEQVAALGEKQVCIYERIMMAGDGKAWEYNGKLPSQIPGTSLLYRRSWWDSNRFPALRAGEDTRFSERAAKVSIGLDGRGRCVASIHDKHTSPRMLGGENYKMVDVSALPKEFEN